MKTRFWALAISLLIPFGLKAIDDRPDQMHFTLFRSYESMLPMFLSSAFAGFVTGIFLETLYSVRAKSRWSRFVVAVLTPMLSVLSVSAYFILYDEFAASRGLLTLCYVGVVLPVFGGRVALTLPRFYRLLQRGYRWIWNGPTASL